MVSKAISRTDDEMLAAMGYKQELHRGLSSFMSFALGFTEVAVLSSLSATFTFAMKTGGPGVTIWGWLIACIFTCIVGCCMAEICSTYPSAGSVYHWAGQLVPEKYGALAAYITGWANFLGNGAGDAVFAAGWSNIFSSAVSASGGNNLTTGQQVILSILILLIWSFFNVLQIDSIGWINNSAAIYQFLSVIIITIALVSASPDLNSGSFVFSEYYNGTGFDNKSYVIAIGLLSACFGFSGYEASAHMAEETHGAEKAASYGVINTCIGTAICGTIYLLGLLFSAHNIPALANTEEFGTGNASVDVYLYACGNKAGAVMAWALVINLFFAGVSSVAVTGRITYSLIRDKAFPYSDVLSGVNSFTKSPVKAIMFIFFIDSFILLLPLANLTAFNAITSLATIGFQISYGIPILLRVLFARKTFVQNQNGFHLGKASVPLSIISCFWLFGTSFLFFFPTESPVDQDSMNYSIVVVAFVFITGALYWIVSARKWFKGPKRMDIDVLRSRVGITEISIGSDTQALVSNQPS